jgi:hypothetical protein
MRWLRVDVSALLAAGLAAALLLSACGGGDESADPAAAKACLDEAGFDTSKPTGLISVMSGGKTIEWRDEFAATRGGAEFLLWFMKSDDDARAVADVLKAQGEAPPGQPRVEGPVALAYRPNTDPQALAAVEECLGL